MFKILNKLKNALYKNGKPKKHDNLFKFKSNSTVKILDGLSKKNKKRIGEWLDSVEVKENLDGEPYITSPFLNSISTPFLGSIYI